MRLAKRGRGRNEQIDWKNARNEWNQKANGFHLCQRKRREKVDENKDQPWCRFVYYAMPCCMLYAVVYLLSIKFMNDCRRKERWKKGTENNVDRVSFDTLILLFEHATLCSALLLLTHAVYRFWRNLFRFFLLLRLRGSGNSICCMFIFDLDKYPFDLLHWVVVFPNALVKWSVWR